MNGRDRADEVRQLRQLIQAIGERCDRLITHIETKGGLDVPLPDDEARVWMLTIEQFRELLDTVIEDGLARGREGALLQ